MRKGALSGSSACLHVLQNTFHSFAVVHLAIFGGAFVSVDQQQQLLLDRLSALVSVYRIVLLRLLVP